jgi:hypothetical protein
MEGGKYKSKFQNKTSQKEWCIMKRKLMSTAITAAILISSISMLDALAADPACREIDPLQYTYEIYPLAEPFNEYFYIKTDNPHPESFRFSDKDSPYSESSVIYNVETTYADVEYENPDLYRVNGGYIFRSFTTNGGQVTLNASDQTVNGDMIVDSVSNLNLYLKDSSSFEGAINTDGQEGEVYVELDSDSTWKLTGDSYITSLTCDADSIDLNGYKLYVNGKEYEEGTESKGEAIEVTVTEGGGDMGDMPGEPPEGMDNPSGGDGNTPPEPPEGKDGNRPEKPGEKSDGNSDAPPEKPDESN